MKHSSAVAIQ